MWHEDPGRHASRMRQRWLRDQVWHVCIQPTAVHACGGVQFDAAIYELGSITRENLTRAPPSPQGRGTDLDSMIGLTAKHFGKCPAQICHGRGRRVQGDANVARIGAERAYDHNWFMRLKQPPDLDRLATQNAGVHCHTPRRIDAHGQAWSPVEA